MHSGARIAVTSLAFFVGSLLTGRFLLDDAWSDVLPRALASAGGAAVVGLLLRAVSRRRQGGAS